MCTTCFTLNPLLFIMKVRKEAFATTVTAEILRCKTLLKKIPVGLLRDQQHLYERIHMHPCEIFKLSLTVDRHYTFLQILFLQYAIGFPNLSCSKFSRLSGPIIHILSIPFIFIQEIFNIVFFPLVLEATLSPL